MIKASDLVAHVASQTTLDASVAALVDGMIAAHEGVQTQLDLANVANDFKANAASLAAAILYGTPAGRPGAPAPVGVTPELIVPQPLAPQDPSKPPVPPVQAAQAALEAEFGKTRACLIKLSEYVESLANTTAGVLKSVPVPLAPMPEGTIDPNTGQPYAA